MIKNRSKICLCISCAIMVIALVLSLCGRGINMGLDFTGGMSMQYKMGGAYEQADIEAILNSMNLGAYTITGQGSDEIIIRINEVDQDNVNAVQTDFEKVLFEKYTAAERTGDMNYVGPVAGKTLVQNAVTSVLIAAALMLVYIAIRFDLNSGLAAVFGLVHDVLMMLSFMVILRSFVQMNSSFIAAALTIVGYSINNTIVIFDRIRENARKMPTDARAVVVNKSVRECLGRTLTTTATTLITIIALFILGVGSIREFALPIIIGIISGVYSANMINGYIWAALEEKKRAGKK